MIYDLSGRSARSGSSSGSPDYVTRGILLNYVCVVYEQKRLFVIIRIMYIYIAHLRKLSPVIRRGTTPFSSDYAPPYRVYVPLAWSRYVRSNNASRIKRAGG